MQCQLQGVCSVQGARRACTKGLECMRRGVCSRVQTQLSSTMWFAFVSDPPEPATKRRRLMHACAQHTTLGAVTVTQQQVCKLQPHIEANAAGHDKTTPVSTTCKIVRLQERASGQGSYRLHGKHTPHMHTRHSRRSFWKFPRHPFSGASTGASAQVPSDRSTGKLPAVGATSAAVASGADGGAESRPNASVFTTAPL